MLSCVAQLARIRAASALRGANYVAGNAPGGGPGHCKYRSTAAAALFPKKPELNVGDEMEGFVVENVSEVPEYHLTAATLRHATTGAQYLHIYRDDSNNAFSVGFRTTPTDSTGLPHILEHTTLCGSVRYPCRDPFFKMLNRSMATFMNAMTGPDYTMYPFATQNPYDYNNLMSVYLDAVFKPQLRQSDFRQEGWRLEHEDPNDPNSSIIFKGVVYNEMKGAFSEPQSVFGQALLNNLLPSHTYGHISGGNPKNIPNLTYEDLKAFHQKFYNPTNAKFYSYGNFALVDHLTYINQNYLDGYKALKEPVDTSVPLEARWPAPRSRHISCRVDPLAADPKKQSTIAVSVLLGDIKDLSRLFEWNVLSELLVKGPNSSFYKSLVEPQIGAGFAPATGFESHTRNTFFSVGLQGVSETDFGRVEEIYDQTVNSVIDKGFDMKQVEAVLHGVELAMKHETADFGLGLLFGLTPLWNHDGDVVRALHVNKQLKDFREKLKANPRLLQDLVAEAVKGNKHRLLLTMSPDEAYEEVLAVEERKLLDAKLEALSEEDRAMIYQDGLELVAQQAKFTDTSCLPTLRVDDLRKELERTPLEDSKIGGVPVQTAVQPTNGLVYFRAALNVSELPEEQKLLLPLFVDVASKMGTKSSTFREMDQKIKSKTGGIGFSTLLAEDPADAAFHEEAILVSSYALDRNVPDMFNLIAEIFNELTLDDLKRFETLTKISASNLANHITDAGHHYAMLSAGALVTGVSKRKESYGGMTHVTEMRRIAQLQDLTPVLEEMRKIARAVLSKTYLRCALNLCPDSRESAHNQLERFLSSLPGRSAAGSVILTPAPEVNESHNAVHHVLPIPVNFLSKAVETVSYTHKDFAALTVLARLLSSKYLHPLIREKGGAYGSGAAMTPSGTMLFYSYRDPNSVATLNAFDGSGSWIRDGQFSDQDLEEAKLGVFQRVDSPIPPGSKGMNRFLYQISDDVLQQHRSRLMAVTKADVSSVASFYLNGTGRRAARALIGPENPDLQAVREQEKWVVRNHE